MTKERLVHLLRCASMISSGQRLILAGSQALYAATDSAPESVRRSEEADLLLVRVDLALFRCLDEQLGMDSPYLRETGVFAHPVGLGTIIAPHGWEQRLTAFGLAEGLENIWALELHDLAASKLMAGRAKDLQFLLELIRQSLLQLETLMERFLTLRSTPFMNAMDDRLHKLAAVLEAAGLKKEATRVRSAV